MQFQRKHRNRTRVHTLAEGPVRVVSFNTPQNERVIVFLENDMDQYRLELTPEEAYELADRILSMKVVRGYEEGALQSIREGGEAR